jgi:hypothetical protein
MVIKGAAMDQFASGLSRMGRDSRSIMATGLNAGGEALRHATVNAEAAQTGLKVATLDRAQEATHASPSMLAFTIRAKGGNVRLKYFGARETPSGVTASPWNASRTYGGAFLKGGRFPNRVGLSMGGQVFRRAGMARLPLEGVRSGLFIPTEMTTGKTAAAFQHGADAVGLAVVGQLAAVLP